MVTLAEHIDACMAESKLRTGVFGPKFHELCHAMANNPDLATQAHAVIQAGAAVEKRDHITRWRSDLLRHALAEAKNVSADLS